jgi:cytochrome c oxidase cbb3-type subunit 3
MPNEGVRQSDMAPLDGLVVGVRRAAGCWTAVLACVLCLAACGVEKRDVGPSPPSSPPSGPSDPRQALYETNAYEMAEGGRMFQWFGCDQCHKDGAPGFLDLSDTRWRQGGATSDIYKAIADGRPGMPGYADRITSQQIWQIAGFVHGLNAVKPNMRRRNALAQQGEPSGSTWSGAIR